MEVVNLPQKCLGDYSQEQAFRLLGYLQWLHCERGHPVQQTQMLMQGPIQQLRQLHCAEPELLLFAQLPPSNAPPAPPRLPLLPAIHVMRLSSTAL